MGGAGSEVSSLSSNPFEQFVPFLSTRECTVPCSVCFGSCLRRVSSFLLSSLLLSSTHPLKPHKFLAALLLISFFFVSISLSGLGMFKSASLWEIFLRGGSCVKVLSVVSGNYLGAKLIALDPTSHRNRLSANLGLWRCSQVSPRQRLHQAVCSSQGFDLCHTLPSSPLSHTTFLSSQSS